LLNADVAVAPAGPASHGVTPIAPIAADFSTVRRELDKRRMDAVDRVLTLIERLLLSQVCNHGFVKLVTFLSAPSSRRSTVLYFLEPNLRQYRDASSPDVINATARL
jgi:hypothetical protein